MPLPRWTARVLSVMTLVLVAVFAAATAFVAIVVPYRFWDSLAFGSWSRSIADTGDVWSNASVLSVSRPVFYVPQGLMWRWVTEDEWAGRLLSALFAGVLVAAVWALGRQLTSERTSRVLLPFLAVAIALSSSVLATYAAAGMTDVPVGAATAVTAVVL